MTPVRQFLVPVLVTALVLWAALAQPLGLSLTWLLAGTCLGWMWRAALASWTEVRAERKEKPPMP